MATYVNDLRLKEIGTGESSGTWGTETTTNLELIGESLGYGTEGITTNADTHTSTVADGSTDPARAMYIKYTGTLDSACTITIGPNTMSRVHIIENATSGSQNIIISQGSGANVTIPAGDVKVVYLDGAGSGAAVVDAFASLNVVDLKVQDDLTVTDDLIVNGDIDLEGSIDVNGTANLDVVDVDGAVDMASTLQVTGNLTTSANNTFTVTDNGTPLTLVSTDADANAGPFLDLWRNSSSPADDDPIGIIRFYGENDNNEAIIYSAIDARIEDVSDGTEDGALQFYTMAAGTSTQTVTMQSGMVGVGIAPSNTFSVGASGTVTTRYTSTDTSAFSLIQHENSGTFVFSADHGAGQANSDFIFKTDGATERMRLLAAGSLGINDSTPAEKLSVGGAIVVEGDHATGVNAMGASVGLLLHATGDTAYVTATSNGSSNRNLQLRSLSSGSANAAQLFLEYTGNVGIGTTSCTNVFDTQFSASAHTSGISITNKQNGGWGSTLAFNSSRSDDSSIKTAARIRTEGAEAWDADATTSSSIIFETRSDNTLAERARLAADGDFAIGTTSVDSKLMVSGESSGGFNSIFRSGTNYQDFSLFFDTANGNGTANFRPITVPGSGAANMAFRFRTITSGSGSTNANVVIDGSLGKGSGSFLIDHPLESMTETHHLYHSFIEGPQADLIYRGKVELVDGKATINIDEASNMTEGTFCSLNRDTQCFTTNETDWDSVKGSVEGNILTIESQNTSSSATISWMVVGERCDKHMFDTDWTDDNGKVITEKVKPENYHGGPEVKQADIAH